MGRLVYGMVALAALTLSACGTFVPDLNDPVTGGPEDEALFVRAVSHRIRCDVQDAVIKLYEEDKKAEPDNKNIAFFDDWGVQISLNLTTDDKGTVSPSANVLPPSPATRIFNLGLGVLGSSEAERVNKVGSFLTIRELKALTYCPENQIVSGPYVLQSDLKLYPWLEAMMIVNGLQDAPFEADATGPQKTNVFSHDIKFEVVTSGNLTPGWKLTEATIDQTGNLLNASRDRTQDVVFTFGPLEKATVVDPKTKKPKTVVVSPARLDQNAASQALASQFGIDVAAKIIHSLRY